MKDNKKNNKGLTLIEVIITVAIIGIITIPILTMFNSGLNNISKAMKRTEDVFEIKDDVNQAIIQSIEGEITTIKVKIPSLNINKDVEGKMVTVEKDNIQIITFVPNN